MLRHRWEVFFITQRPFTAGETVQRQTQRWLVAQGFDLPSVLVLHGSRGTAAAALRLDYHVDDRPQNCIDVSVDSNAKTILIVPESNQTAVASARKLGIGVVHRIGDALDILDQATLAQTNPSLFTANREDGGLEIRQSAVVSRESSVTVDSRSRQSSRQSSRSRVRLQPDSEQKKAGGAFASGHPNSLRNYYSIILTSLQHSALSIQHCVSTTSPARRSG